MRVCGIVLGVLVALGCASDPTASTGALTIESSGDGASGSFVDASEAELGRVDFSSRFVEEHVLEIVLDFHGLTITSLVDFESGVIEHDGFSSDNGEDSQMLDDDRALLITFARALDELGTDVDEPLDRLRSFVSTWSEYPETVDLAGIALFDQDRSYTSICAYVNSYQAATHDDWDYDYWEDASTLDYAYVSMHAAGSCSDGTYFWKNGSWQCYEPDHDSSVEYAYGNCLGRCGASCGSDRQFTWDCLDHDSCVRTGHDTASLWCDDEFSATVDDWAAAPNCG